MASSRPLTITAGPAAMLDLLPNAGFLSQNVSRILILHDATLQQRKRRHG
jgi:hypothetical protein